MAKKVFWNDKLKSQMCADDIDNVVLPFCGGISYVLVHECIGARVERFAKKTSYCAKTLFCRTSI